MHVIDWRLFNTAFRFGTTGGKCIADTRLYGKTPALPASTRSITVSLPVTSGGIKRTTQR